jgi:hypothetical protein
VFAALRERLGRGWREKAVPATAGSALGLPLTVIGFLLFFNFIAFMAALQEEGKLGPRPRRGQGGGGLIALIGSTAFLVLAALLFVVGVVWLVYAIRNRPPAVVTLTRATEPAA